MKNHHSKHGESSNYMGRNHHVSMAIFQKFQPCNRRGSPKETNTRGAMAFFLQDCVRQDPDHREWNEVNVFPSSTSVYIYLYLYLYICMYMYIRRHLYGLSEHMVHMHMLRYSYWFIMPFKASPVSIPIGRLYTSYSWLCIYIYILLQHHVNHVISPFLLDIHPFQTYANIIYFMYQCTPL